MVITPKSLWPAVKAMLHSVYDQPDAPRADILAFTSFPVEVWHQL